MAGTTVTVADVAAAAGRIAPYIRRTPVLAAEPGAFGVAARVTLKLEMLQHTGSFKPRGAFNRMLRAGVGPGDVVVAASGGNHGLAVAYAATRLGGTAEIFVPKAISPAKLLLLQRLGARVEVGGDYYADALAASLERAAGIGALAVHAYDDPDVVAGQATVAVEIAEQAPDATTVVVAVGGGGLMAGVATAVAPGIAVVAVEPTTTPTLHAALAAGEPVDVDVSGVAADSLGARRIGVIALAVAQRTGARSVLVSDADIVVAQRLLWQEFRIVVEPAGAAALAALTGGVVRPAPDEHVVVVLCGANTAPPEQI